VGFSFSGGGDSNLRHLIPLEDDFLGLARTEKGEMYFWVTGWVGWGDFMGVISLRFGDKLQRTLAETQLQSDDQQSSFIRYPSRAVYTTAVLMGVMAAIQTPDGMVRIKKCLNKKSNLCPHQSRRLSNCSCSPCSPHQRRAAGPC